MKKLQNKETGEIGRLVLNTNPNRESYSVLSTENGNTICGNLVIADYDTLDQLNAEWEDYEEPKLYLYIEDDGCMRRERYSGGSWDEFREQIGNYFETKEEAEKAVEKLKAWKRLKDKGFKFVGYLAGDEAEIDRIYAEFPYLGDTEADLELLFGGE